MRSIPSAKDILGKVQVADGTTTTQLLAIDSSGRITIANGFDQTLPTFTTGSHTTSTRHIVAEIVPGATPITVNPNGGQVKILDSAGTNLLSVDAAGSIPVRPQTNPWPVGGSVQLLQQDAISGGLIVSLEPIIDGQGRLASSFAAHITTNATTNVVGSTAYLASLVITTDATGTGSTITIQDKSVTPKKLVNGLGTTALTTTPNVLTFADQAVLMTGGIDIVTAGAVAATVDVWVTYLQ